MSQEFVPKLSRLFVLTLISHRHHFSPPAYLKVLCLDPSFSHSILLHSHKFFKAQVYLFIFYADDTQLYISFSPALSHTPLSLLSSTLDLVHTWFTNNRLCLNPSRTEYIIIGSPYHRSKISSTAISISGNQIKSVTSSRNLGIIFESDLSLRKHIFSICQTSLYHIRQLRQIRSSIDINSATILANALVHCKLDYCNSLHYSLPNSSIH